MRVIMFGYQTWGHRTPAGPSGLAPRGALVVTHPRTDHPYEQIWADSVADLAEEHNVPVPLRQKPDDDVAREVARVDADIIVATNWRTWLPPSIFTLPRYGTLNVHDAPLPAYAGFSPPIWALINGELEVGVTAHLMNDQLDGGDIVLQRAVAVGPTDTTTDLFHRPWRCSGRSRSTDST